MKGLFLVFLLVASSSYLLVEGEKEQRFREWLAKYRGKIPEEKLDLAEVYLNWLQNAKFVDEHNSLDLKYKVDLNVFAYKKFAQPLTAEDRRAPGVAQGDSNPNIPSSVDWRTKDGVVQPVIDMGQLHNSKAIAVVRGIEGMRAITNKERFSLSFVEVENCCSDSGNIYQCIVDIGGLAADNVYPRNSTVCLSKSIKPVATIGGGIFIPQKHETGMAEAVAKQPIIVGLDAGKASFMLYKQGVYSDSQCSQVRIDHYMLVVGYGTYEGQDYWLCQNTWGSSWGMEGFIMIERGSNTCGVAMDASYPY